MAFPGRGGTRCHEPGAEEGGGRGALQLVPKWWCPFSTTAPKLVTFRCQRLLQLLFPHKHRRVSVELKCHTCVDNAQTCAMTHTNVHARTSDCQLTFNTHRGGVYVGGPRLFNQRRKGHPDTLTPLLPTSKVTLGCVTGLKRSVAGLPSRFFCRSRCLLRLSFPPSSLRQLRHWWVPRVLGRADDVMTHERRSARSRHERSCPQIKRF